MGLTPIQMGYLLSAFFWSYTGFHLVAGWMADRYPVQWVFGAGFLLWSAATMGSAFAGGLASLFLFRLVLGAGESVAFPCYSKVIAAGFPAERRGLPNAFLEAGTKLGPAVGTLAGGLLVARYGWRVMFFALGAASLIWLISLGDLGTSPDCWRVSKERRPRHAADFAAERRMGYIYRQFLLHIRLLLFTDLAPFLSGERAACFAANDEHIGVGSVLGSGSGSGDLRVGIGRLDQARGFAHAGAKDIRDHGTAAFHRNGSRGAGA